MTNKPSFNWLILLMMFCSLLGNTLQLPEQLISHNEKTPVATAAPAEIGVDYILNTNTMKFHYPDCKSVDQMKEKNKAAYTGSRDELIDRGYSPCGNCKP